MSRSISKEIRKAFEKYNKQNNSISKEELSKMKRELAITKLVDEGNDTSELEKQIEIYERKLNRIKGTNDNGPA